MLNSSKENHGFLTGNIAESQRDRHIDFCKCDYRLASLSGRRYSLHEHAQNDFGQAQYLFMIKYGMQKFLLF